jgi:hypothetical protein
MIGYPRRRPRDPDDDPESLRQRLRRGLAFLLVAFAAAVLFTALMEATRVVWHWLGWG